MSRLHRALLLGLCTLPLLGAGEDLPGDARRRVQADAQEYVGLSQRIWELAEPAMKEFRSARLLADNLRHHGFQVEMGVAGMPTAFVARAGRGRPVVGLLAEYDGLPGLSQKAQAVRAALEEGGVGHGCGHNLLGVAAVAAARSAAATLREQDLPGTVILYGTPAEETGVGKVFMARAAEELYRISTDRYQLDNLAGDDEHAETLAAMREVLSRWSAETGDTVPEKPTPDREDAFGKKHRGFRRGTMPGTATDAANITNPGPR